MRGEEVGLDGAPDRSWPWPWLVSAGPKLENAKLSRPGGGESAAGCPPDTGLRLLDVDVNVAGGSLRVIGWAAGGGERTRTIVSLLDDVRFGFSLISAWSA